MPDSKAFIPYIFQGLKAIENAAKSWNSAVALRLMNSRRVGAIASHNSALL